LFKPLLQRISDLEARVENVEQSRPSEVTGESLNELPEEHVSPGFRKLITHIAVPILLLLTAHLLITVVYDLNTLYLRIVSLLVQTFSRRRQQLQQTKQPPAQTRFMVSPLIA
jgi:hypothetical protein